MKIRQPVIVFDFDGVVVDSNQIKYDAWFNLFPDSESVSDQLIEQALREVKETRFDILDFIFSRLGQASSQREQNVQVFAQKYNTLVQAEIQSRGLMPGARETLERLRRSHQLFINSATPEQALAETLQALDLRQLFVGAYGKPASKSDNLKKIAARTGVNAEQILFVGDSSSDWQAAQYERCRFIGVRNAANGWTTELFPVVNSITELVS